MDSNQDLENNKQSTDGLSAGVDNEVKTVDKLEQENAMMNTAPKKKGSTMVLGMVLMAIAMICGVGFGIWTMMDAEAQKSEFNSQISSLRQENAELKEKTSVSLDDTEEIVDIEAGYENVDSADFIYVGDWGLKISVAEELELVTYSYDYGDGNTVLSVSGATRDGQSIPDFAKVENCTLGVVVRYSNYNVEAGLVPGVYGDPFMSDNEHSYYYRGPQVLCTLTQDYDKWEQETAGVIKNMLIDKNNYTKI